MSNEVRVALISTVGGIAIALIGQGIFFPPPTDKPDLSWVSTTHADDCPSVCKTKGLNSVVSGTSNSEDKYHICSASEYGRPGFNIRSTGWQCYVGENGEERNYQRFKCLCKNFN